MRYALSLILLLVCSATLAENDVSIVVKWDQVHQTITGFGGTMGWIHPHPQKRDEVYDLLFKELGVSVLRVQALGGEGGDESTPEPENDNGDPDVFDWSKLKYRETEARCAATIKAAQARGVKTIIPVTWSPPGWMKTSGKRAGTGGKFKAECAAELAECWTGFVLAMKRDFGIDIELISIQNEPDLTYYYPTCGYAAADYAKAVAAVRARFEKEKLSTQVLGPDTCRIYHLPDYVEAIDKENASPGTPILTHLYDLSIPFGKVDRDPERWKVAATMAAKHKRSLWLMETANYLSAGVDPASYDEAMIWAQKIHSALVDGNCEVVCYWQLFFDKKGEALIYCEKSEAEKYEITPKFHTSMNYFKFVRPGMKRCEATLSQSGLLVSAFKNDAGERVVVVVNPGTSAATISLQDDTAGWRRHLTTSEKKCIVDGTGRAAQIEIPKRSVMTLVQTPK